ncbi:hypothetical protein PR048_030645 [Dryococelus australis]|uniref:Uncharacterized protein n=1 Tax=Dryococelus australis TaxID=614101 RepID=A0ABQ9GDD2_9NEOP|nr:hypothetical protein PR048_030645 [Dryococelus australis]
MPVSGSQSEEVCNLQGVGGGVVGVNLCLDPLSPLLRGKTDLWGGEGVVDAMCVCVSFCFDGKVAALYGIGVCSEQRLDVTGGSVLKLNVYKSEDVSISWAVHPGSVLSKASESAQFTVNNLYRMRLEDFSFNDLQVVCTALCVPELQVPVRWQNAHCTELDATVLYILEHNSLVRWLPLQTELILVSDLVAQNEATTRPRNVCIRKIYVLHILSFTIFLRFFPLWDETNDLACMQPGNDKKQHMLKEQGKYIFDRAVSNPCKRHNCDFSVAAVHSFQHTHQILQGPSPSSLPDFFPINTALMLKAYTTNYLIMSGIPHGNLEPIVAMWPIFFDEVKRVGDSTDKLAASKISDFPHSYVKEEVFILSPKDNAVVRCCPIADVWYAREERTGLTKQKKGGGAMRWGPGGVYFWRARWAAGPARCSWKQLAVSTSFLPLLTPHHYPSRKLHQCYNYRVFYLFMAIDVSSLMDRDDCLSQELAVHIRCAQQEPATRAELGETGFTAATHERTWLDYSPPTKANWVRFPVGPPPGCSQLGIVPLDDAGRQVFLGISRFPRPCIRRCSILTSLHPHRLSRPRCEEPSTYLHSLIRTPAAHASEMLERCSSVRHNAHPQNLALPIRDLKNSRARQLHIAVSNQWGLFICVTVHKSVESNLQVIELANFSCPLIFSTGLRRLRRACFPANLANQRQPSYVSDFSRSLHSAVASSSPRFMIVGSQDLGVKSRPNLFTSPFITTRCQAPSRTCELSQHSPPGCVILLIRCAVVVKPLASRHDLTGSLPSGGRTRISTDGNPGCHYSRVFSEYSLLLSTIVIFPCSISNLAHPTSPLAHVYRTAIVVALASGRSSALRLMHTRPHT